MTSIGPTAAPAPTSTPRPIKSLPGGKQIYNFSHGAGVIGPKLQQVVVDPLTPGVGETQAVTITIKHDSPVTEASVVLLTDIQTTVYPLTLIAGTTTDGTWQGSWKIPETYNYNYYLKFSLKSATGNYNDGLKLR
jgi:hypothetical protein